MNRGDIEGIREVWVEETYRPPFDMHPAVVVDLGANIGFTSVFFAIRYKCTTIVAVEPAPANAELARRNFQANSVAGQVVEAAVGPCDGTIGFEEHRDSNRGRTGGTECPVPMLSMSSILALTPNGKADLVKMDIEGGEEALLLGDVSWLANVGALIVEFHPPLVDKPRLVAVLEGAGFRYIPADSVWPRSMDSFIRDGWPDEVSSGARSVPISSR
ncbi:MAG: FkbM family methyltransferase [Acidimicrobiales bacterium]